MAEEPPDQTGAPSPDLSALADVGLEVSIEVDVARVTLNKPESLNSQTPAMWDALRGVGASLPGSVRVVVVTGRGRAFSAGLDRGVFSDPDGVVGLASAPTEHAEAQIARWQDAFNWLTRPDLISIAAVQGFAIGGGFQLALACDLRVLAEDAVFSMAEVSLGLVPDLGGTKRLVELVGYSRAAELCLTGRRVSAAEADRIGLATAVTSRQSLVDTTEKLVGALLAPARDAQIEIKALLTAAAGRGTGAQQAAERTAQVRRIRDLAGAGE